MHSPGSLRTQPDANLPPNQGAHSGTGWRQAVCSAVGAAAGTWFLARVFDPVPFVHAALWLFTGLVVLPLSFALALALVVCVLSGGLALLAVPTALRRRPVGLAAAFAALWSLPAGILPGYWQALRRVRRPWLWGALLGFVLGVAAFAAICGLRPRT
jgi:hypothetical protein